MSSGLVSGDAGAQRPSARVIVASNRAAAGVYPDDTGPLIVEALTTWGFDVTSRVVADGDPVGAALRAAIDDDVDLILTTGGTGISPTDQTPEVTAPLLDRPVPGIAEAIRGHGVAKGVPTAMLSRGLAGAAGKTLIVNLPGSKGGVADALEVLAGVVGHAISQLGGGDH